MEPDEIVVCCVCSSNESDLNTVITCMYCFSSSHLKCRGITTRAAHRIREKPYFCSTKCAEIYQKITEMQQNEKSLVSSISSQLNTTVAKVVEAQMQSVKKEVQEVVTAVQTSQQFLSDKFDTIKTEFDNLKTDNVRLNSEIDILKRSQSSLTETVYKLESSVDKSNKLAVARNVIILGLPSAADENVANIVARTFHCIGVDLKTISFTASRLYPANKNSKVVVPIRVTFNDVPMKDYVLDKKREFGQLKSTTVDISLLFNGIACNVAIH